MKEGDAEPAGSCELCGATGPLVAASAGAVCERCEVSRKVEAVKHRLHIVEGMRRALDETDAVGFAVDNAKDREAATTALMDQPFGFSNPQAQHILDMTLSRRTLLARAAMREEYERLQLVLERLTSET